MTTANPVVIAVLNPDFDGIAGEEVM